MAECSAAVPARPTAESGRPVSVDLLPPAALDWASAETGPGSDECAFSELDSGIRGYWHTRAAAGPARQECADSSWATG